MVHDALHGQSLEVLTGQVGHEGNRQGTEQLVGMVVPRSFSPIQERLGPVDEGFDMLDCE